MRARNPVIRLSHATDRGLRRVFFRVGFTVASNPFKTLLITSVLVVISLVGLLRFRSESRADELWVPQGTVALSNQEYVVANYGRTARVSSIAFTVRDNGPELLSKPAMMAMLDVAGDAFDVVAEGGVNVRERCLKISDANGKQLCRTNSVFGWFYDEDSVVIDAQGRVDFFESVKQVVENMDDAQIAERVEQGVNGEIESVGGVVLNGEEIVGKAEDGTVRVLRYTQIIENRAVDVDGERVDEDADRLDEAWTEFLINRREQGDAPVTWFVDSLYSQEEALGEALSGDLPLLSFGFLLLTVYVIMFLGDFHSVRSHRLLALGALLTTGLSLGGCFGISSALGMFFGPVHQILPLLIVGIGIDDCFHVTRAADEEWRKEESKGKSLEVKIGNAMSRSGAAITVTSFTNVIVFLLSAISKLPALRFFALWAAIGIFLAWLLSITFYTALLTFDFRRISKGKKDYIPFCVPCGRGKAGGEVSETNWFGKQPGGFSRFFGNTFGPFIMNIWVKSILLVLFIAGFAACCYGTSQLYLKFRFSFFYPDGSEQRDYQNLIDEYFQLGDPTDIYVRDTDLSTPANQARLLRLCTRDTGLIAKDAYIQGDTVDCFLPALRSSLDLPSDDPIPASDFVPLLKTFISQGAGARFSEDLVFNAEGTMLTGCRFAAQYVYRETNDDEIDALDSVRQAAASAGFGEGPDGNPAAFPYVFFDTFSEQYAALPGEIGVSLGLASAAVALVCFVLVGHPLVAVICVLVVGVIIIDVLGLTYFADVNLNSVSVITLVLATGLSVDLVVHVARAFLEHVGTRKERAIKALETMGPPVFYAGFSTFLAIVILAAAKSYIFQVLFKGFLFLLVVGGLHGLIFGPLVLSIVGPRSFYESEEDKREQEEKLEMLARGETKDVDATEEKLGRADMQAEV